MIFSTKKPDECVKLSQKIWEKAPKHIEKLTINQRFLKYEIQSNFLLPLKRICNGKGKFSIKTFRILQWNKKAKHKLIGKQK